MLFQVWFNLVNLRQLSYLLSFVLTLFTTGITITSYLCTLHRYDHTGGYNDFLEMNYGFKIGLLNSQLRAQVVL